MLREIGRKNQEALDPTLKNTVEKTREGIRNSPGQNCAAKQPHGDSITLLKAGLLTAQEQHRKHCDLAQGAARGMCRLPFLGVGRGGLSELQKLFDWKKTSGSLRSSLP